MYLSRLSIAIGLLPFLFEPAQSQACTNVTIASADDAAEVRKNCPTITGHLTLATSLSEDINLDGVETILGDIIHYGCEEDYDPDCPETTNRFALYSSTLSFINDSINFWDFNGLEEIRFPNLTRVEEDVYLHKLRYLTRLDIPKLTHLGSITVHAGKLTTINHEGLQGFTDGFYSGGITFSNASVDSVDSWFKYPLEVNRKLPGLGNDSGHPTIDINGHFLPNLRKITLGWSKPGIIRIRGDDMSVTLGGENTTSMELEGLILDGNITGVERGPVLETLSVEEVTVQETHERAVNLTFLDSVGALTLYRCHALENLTMPPKAVDWEDFSLSIVMCRQLWLTSEYRDPETEKDRFWYWPRGDMRSIKITASHLDNNFFKSFLEARAGNDSSVPRVLESFSLDPSGEEDSAELDCTPFEELRNRSVLPEEFYCRSQEASGSKSIASARWSAVAAAFLTGLLWLT